MFMSIIIFSSLEKLYLHMFDINYFEHCDKKMAIMKDEAMGDLEGIHKAKEMEVNEDDRNDIQDNMQDRIHGFILGKINHYDLDMDRVMVACSYSKFLNIRPNEETYKDGRFMVFFVRFCVFFVRKFVCIGLGINNITQIIFKFCFF